MKYLLWVLLISTISYGVTVDEVVGSLDTDNKTSDIDGDGEVTSSDLALVLNNRAVECRILCFVWMRDKISGRSVCYSMSSSPKISTSAPATWLTDDVSSTWFSRCAEIFNTLVGIPYLGIQFDNFTYGVGRK